MILRGRKRTSAICPFCGVRHYPPFGGSDGPLQKRHAENKKKEIFDSLVGLSLLFFFLSSLLLSLFSSLSIAFYFHSFFFLFVSCCFSKRSLPFLLPPLPVFSGDFQLSRFFCLPDSHR